MYWSLSLEACHISSFLPFDLVLILVFALSSSYFFHLLILFLQFLSKPITPSLLSLSHTHARPPLYSLSMLFRCLYFLNIECNIQFFFFLSKVSCMIIILEITLTKKLQNKTILNKKKCQNVSDNFKRLINKFVILLNLLVTRVPLYICKMCRVYPISYGPGL